MKEFQSIRQLQVALSLKQVALLGDVRCFARVLAILEDLLITLHDRGKLKPMQMLKSLLIK